MAAQSGIQWTTNTWNPWQGCRKVSQGCRFCYMYRDKERYGQNPTAVVRSAPTTFNAPLRKGKHAFAPGSLVFTCSWSDWLIEEADAWRPEAWDIIRRTPHLTYQILTKRLDRVLANPALLPPDWGDGYPNVWFGVSTEDQKAYDVRAAELAQVPARVRFLSMEPLLGPIDMHLTGTSTSPLSSKPRPVDWCIVGGESGTAATSRVCNAGWLRSVVTQCRAADVPVFVKQLGSQFYDEQNGIAGRLLPLAPGVRVAGTYTPGVRTTVRRLQDSHGGDPAEWPPGLNVREFPRCWSPE